MMEEIQATGVKRREASVFVRQLKCLQLVDSGDAIKFKEACINVLDQDAMCAIISYPWKRPRYERKEAGSCFIKDDAGRSRRSKVRYSVCRRAAAYMRYEKVEYLWIDAECIAQEDSEEKQRAIDEMDWLYHHGTHPFGMLTRTVKEKFELYLLAQILQGDMLIQSKYSGEVLLKEGITAKVCAAIRLLDKITSDIWWTRAWIYQENYHGGECMNLLMPHKRKFEDLKLKHAGLFGTLEGELVIKSIEFSEVLTDLCLAFIRSSPIGFGFHKGVATRIISRAGRYSALLETQSSMSPTIIADVGKRDVTKHPDRLSIIANCCSYNYRLNSEKLESKRYSVSLATLVLFLLNGEIFWETSWDTTSPTDLTIVEFIQRYAFEGFSPPPFENYELTFNKKCRFVEPRLERDGVHTRGHLWQLWKRAIFISCEESKEWRTTEETLLGLQKYIERRFRQDSEQIARSLEGPREGLREKSLLTPADWYMCKMAETVADALKSGSTLRLGFLCNPRKPGWSPPTAVFICPDEAMDPHGPSFVFTSFRAKKTSDGPGFNDVDKHVSLQVDVRNSVELPPKLSARAWMHGLWFCKETAQSVVFPLPRILREL